MSETIDISKLACENSFASWLVFNALGSIDKELSQKVYEATVDGKATISLTINGVALPFLETLESLEKQHKRMVKEAANDLAFTTLSDKMNKLYRLVDEAETEMRQIFGLRSPNED